MRRGREATGRRHEHVRHFIPAARLVPPPGIVYGPLYRTRRFSGDPAPVRVRLARYDGAAVAAPTRQPPGSVDNM